MRDLVESRDGLPRHVGLQHVVDLEAPSIDAAVDEALSWAETAAFMIAAATRAPLERLIIGLAYEITPGVAERDFRQWFWDPEVPTSKPVANAVAFGELRERMDALPADGGPSKLLWRTILSMSWFDRRSRRRIRFSASTSCGSQLKLSTRFSTCITRSRLTNVAASRGCGGSRTKGASGRRGYQRRST